MCATQKVACVTMLISVLLIPITEQTVDKQTVQVNPDNKQPTEIPSINVTNIESLTTTISRVIATNTELDDECSADSDCPTNAYCCGPQDNDCEEGGCKCLEKYEYQDGECVSINAAYKMVTTIALVVSLILISAIVIAFACYVITYIHVKCHRRLTTAVSVTSEETIEADEPPTYSEVQSQDEKPPTYQEYISSITGKKTERGIDNPCYTSPFCNIDIPTAGESSTQTCAAPSSKCSGILLDPSNIGLPAETSTLQAVVVDPHSSNQQRGRSSTQESRDSVPHNSRIYIT